MGRLQWPGAGTGRAMEVDLLPGWGSGISVVLPLDPPARAG